MAGPFTHFAICYVAKELVSTQLSRLLNKYLEFLYLGAVSPDLPYLSIDFGPVNWADVMHHEKTNGTVINGFQKIKGNWASNKPETKAMFVWLMGFVSHLIADSTIHPIVVKATGEPYEQWKKQHRQCEMTEDSMIFKKYFGVEIENCDFPELLKFCDGKPYFEQLMEFWAGELASNYPDKDDEPDTSSWFHEYSNVIDVSDGGSVAVVCRHINLGDSYFYKPSSEVQGTPQFKKYYDKVKLPTQKNGNFDADGFQRSVGFVADAWNKLFSGLTSQIDVASFVFDCNLDTGKISPNGIMPYWST
jgi:hypothetical protein